MKLVGKISYRKQICSTIRRCVEEVWRVVVIEGYALAEENLQSHTSPDTRGNASGPRQQRSRKGEGCLGSIKACESSATAVHKLQRLIAQGTNAKRAQIGEARFHRNREAFLSPERSTEIDEHANQTNTANALRIKDLAQKLENAQSAIDVMFKVPDQN